jgi:hypothetical protein
MRVSDCAPGFFVDVQKKSCYYQINYDPHRKTELAQPLFSQAKTRGALVNAWYRL